MSEYHEFPIENNRHPLNHGEALLGLVLPESAADNTDPRFFEQKALEHATGFANKSGVDILPNSIRNVEVRTKNGCTFLDFKVEVVKKP